MIGFCETGIILMPKGETYDNRPIEFKLGLKVAVENIIKYFARFNITFECFTTDEVATMIRPSGIKWVNASTTEDSNFIKNNLSEYEFISEGRDLGEFYDKARKKFPIKRGLTSEDRTDIILERDKFTANRYISEQKLVLDFQLSNNGYYSVKPLLNDGRIILSISTINFTVQAYMSGNPIDLIMLLGDKQLSKPISMWRF